MYRNILGSADSSKGYRHVADAAATALESLNQLRTELIGYYDDRQNSDGTSEELSDILAAVESVDKALRSDLPIIRSLHAVDNHTNNR